MLHRGPAEKQVLEPLEELNDAEYELYGNLSVEETRHISKVDKQILNTVNQCTNGKVTPRVSWPVRDVKPVSEYSDEQIFCLAFPWLFPGGVGDINDPRLHEIDISDWAQNLLYYEDGRFAKDKLWSFFALNFIFRRRNEAQSRFFVKDFVGDSPPSLNDLKNKIASGDTTFIDKLMYFGKNISGSSAYWRSKKAELYSWINYHIEKGRGAPNVFMTLSCAEYFWPDLKRLLQEYIFLCEGKEVDLDKDHAALNKALNDYAIVVQEFFHLRVNSFLKTIGLEVFGIKYYWGRFEFAKSRGQIHLHLLAIVDDIALFETLWNLKGQKQEQDDLLAEWAKQRFNLTATIEEQKYTVPEEQAHSPCKLRFCQTVDSKVDQQLLCKDVQMHECSGFCLRHVKVLKTKNSETEVLIEGSESTVSFTLEFFIIFRIYFLFSKNSSLFSFL